MVQTCVVNGCKETDANSALSFYRFPEDECMRKRWLMAIRRNNCILLKETVICSKHFLPEGFDINHLGIKTLKPDSVPSIFSIQDHYHEIEKLKQKLLKDREILKKLGSRKKLTVDKSLEESQSRSNLEVSLISEDNTETVEPDDNLEEPPTKRAREDVNLESPHNIELTEDDDDIREISVDSYQFDDFEDSINYQESTDSLYLPNNMVKIQRLIAHHRSISRKKSRTLQQKIRRQTCKIRKHYETIRNLCSHFSQIKRRQTNENKMQIDVHPLTNNPTAAWKELSKNQKVIKIHVTPPKQNVTNDKVRFVCMSDTHSLTPHIKFDIPFGDVFIHAGDFSRCGGLEEVLEFNNWIGRLPHKHKIVIAGNHELSFDRTFTHPLTHSPSEGPRGSHIVDEIPTLGLPRGQIAEAVTTQNIKDCLTNCTYLQDETVTISGIKIFGTPWQPEFCKWAFNVPRGHECLSKWDVIPDDTDILVTHTPPIGHGDLCCTGVRAGCVELLSTVQKRVKPKYHVFGHIHEGYGISSDGKIIFINASTCDINYLPTNPPVIFDVPLPPGVRKD